MLREGRLHQLSHGTRGKSRGEITLQVWNVISGASAASLRNLWRYMARTNS